MIHCFCDQLSYACITIFSQISKFCFFSICMLVQMVWAFIETVTVNYCDNILVLAKFISLDITNWSAWHSRPFLFVLYLLASSREGFFNMCCSCKAYANRFPAISSKFSIILEHFTSSNIYLVELHLSQ